MAISYVGGTSSSFTTAGTGSVSYSPTSGNAVIVFLTVSNASGTGFACKDSNNTALTLVSATPLTYSSKYLVAFYYFAGSGVTSFSANWSSANGSGNIVVVEYSGVSAFNASLSGNTATGTSSAPTITVTTEDANDYVVALIGDSTSSITSASTGTWRLNATSNATYRAAVIDNTAASAGSVTCTSGQTVGAAGWGVVAIELRSTASDIITEQMQYQYAIQ